MDTADEVDVVIVGAGISGIGAAATLRRERPGTRFLVLEARERIGGTWDLFRYPGVRSDSDLYTFGYAFKPWRNENSIASAGQVLDYLTETVAEHDLARHIRFGFRVLSAEWDSAQAQWTTRVEEVATGERRSVRSRWLFSASGYFRYDAGYTPQLPGLASFAGEVVHPQRWPDGLSYTNKRVLIVGSGSTAVTLLPALARTAARVVMLQRTPSYVLSSPSRDWIALMLRRLLGDRLAYPLIRRKNIATQVLLWRASRRWPGLIRRLLRRATARQLPEGYPVDIHFAPPYDPWDQRLCLVPDGDFFAAIRRGNAEVVTDEIGSFDPAGVTLASGGRIDADIVITATGLQLQALGGITLTVDGEQVDVPQRVAYKGMMLSGVPNLVFAVGYTNAAWTLKIGLISEHFCRLLEHMDNQGLAVYTPVAPPALATRPLLNLTSGYVRRSAAILPRQGTAAPWATAADYRADVRMLRGGEVADPALHFREAPGVSPPPVL